MCQKKSRLSEELYEDSCVEAVGDGFGLCESVGGHLVGSQKG